MQVRSRPSGHLSMKKSKNFKKKIQVPGCQDTPKKEYSPIRRGRKKENVIKEISNWVSGRETYVASTRQLIGSLVRCLWGYEEYLPPHNGSGFFLDRDHGPMEFGDRQHCFQWRAVLTSRTLQWCVVVMAVWSNSVVNR